METLDTLLRVLTKSLSQLDSASEDQRTPLTEEEFATLLRNVPAELDIFSHELTAFSLLKIQKSDIQSDDSDEKILNSLLSQIILILDHVLQISCSTRVTSFNSAFQKSAAKDLVKSLLSFFETIRNFSNKQQVIVSVGVVWEKVKLMKECILSKESKVISNQIMGNLLLIKDVKAEIGDIEVSKEMLFAVRKLVELCMRNMNCVVSFLLKHMREENVQFLEAIGIACEAVTCALDACVSVFYDMEMDEIVSRTKVLSVRLSSMWDVLESNEEFLASSVRVKKKVMRGDALCEKSRALMQQSVADLLESL